MLSVPLDQAEQMFAEQPLKQISFSADADNGTGNVSNFDVMDNTTDADPD